MFRVIIAGSRNFHNYAMLKAYADKMLSSRAIAGEQITILSGHCRGTDLLGERYAAERGYGLRVYPAEWTKYSLSAGPRRNRQMAAEADALIAVWDGLSRGTRNMIEEAQKAGLAIRILHIKNDRF